QPQAAQCAPVLLRPGAAARPARDGQEQLRNQIDQPERKRDRHREFSLSAIARETTPRNPRIQFSATAVLAPRIFASFPAPREICVESAKSADNPFRLTTRA